MLQTAKILVSRRRSDLIDMRSFSEQQTAASGNYALRAAATVNGDHSMDHNGADAPLHYYDPNLIHPHTDTLRQSLVKFVLYTQKLVQKSQKRQARLRRFQQKLAPKSSSRSSRKKSWIAQLKNLNEQRKSLVLLADYGPSLVTPSFTFLLLGSLLRSVIPYYYARCIQLVATLDPQYGKVAQALFGLLIANTYVAR
jgi:hypothetical protein